MENVLSTFNVNLFGRGVKPIIFAHGLACDQNVWNYVAPAYEADYKVILFDFIGSGNSDRTAYDREKHSSLVGYAADVLSICEALNVKDVIFVGHSVSAIIGLLAAIKRPDIFSEMIMIGPSPCYLNLPSYNGGFDKKEIIQLLDLIQKDYEQWVSHFVPLTMANPERPELSEEVEHAFCKSDPDITYDFAKVTFLSDNRNDLSKLTIPTLIMQMSEDIIAPTHVGEYVHNHIPGSSICYMNATGHFPHLSAVDETINSIKHFLKREDTESAASSTKHA